MGYSTIKKKRCKCSPDCRLFPTLGYDGYAYSHAPEEIKERVGSKRKVAQRNKNARIADAAKLRKLNPTTEQENELYLWFSVRMNICLPVCENCGAEAEFLKEEKYKNLWKSCQAHLLPKRHFTSLKSHPLNGMVLGTGYSQMCHCHDDYDSSWEKASTMNIWPEVVRRFKIMYPLILPSEHRFIPQALLDTLN